MEPLISRNPATGQTIQTLTPTPLAEIPGIFERARQAQKNWALLSVKKRAKTMINFRETLLTHLDEYIDLISAENGKPKFEALAMEIIPSLDLITYFSKRAPKLLKDRPIPLSNPIVLHRQSSS
jgi:succinate-semialdehyde dehydrogenase/glutarate-semialdehyde dehydrogenase